MSWFDRFRKPKVDVIQVDVPMTTILRWYLYDTAMAEPNSVADELGLTLVSQEGDSKEKEDSEIRVGNILPILPYLESISDISANVLTSIHLKEMREHNSEMAEEFEAEIETMATVYKAVALSTLIGAFSIGTTLDLIHLAGISSEVDVDMEDYDE